MPTIETAGIVSKPRSEAAARIVPALVRWLEERGVRVRLDTETSHYAHRSPGVPRSDVPRGAQLIIVLGGDGTLLSAARAIAGSEIPIFAVNLGGLGFLTSITVDEMYTQLEDVLEGDFRVARRRMLHCEHRRGSDVMARYEALNDVVLAKFEIARMIELEMSIDDHFVCVYRADGLIIATPTGSTAYSLSAGGPIVFPSVGAIAVTPICPHTLTNRPVVLDDASTIQITNLADDSATYLTIDGQVGELLKRGDVVVCRRSENLVRLILPPEVKFFDVLREKLGWNER